MRFRPCIDIHNGKVKQIVGGSLRDKGDSADENFVSDKDGAYYASFYRRDSLRGGHIILLNPESSPYYKDTKAQAMLALREWPGAFMIGGGINDSNAGEFLDAGASHVIVTSYVFKDGRINYENLDKMVNTVGSSHLVLDLSCRKRDGKYYIVTDRWQKFTDVEVTARLLDSMTRYCSEYLIHAVDVEGKASGVEEKIACMLGELKGFPVTYAGGVGSYEDIQALRRFGRGHVDVTIGSALDLFGGDLEYRKVLEYFDH